MWLGIVQKKSMVLVKIKQRLGDMLLNLLKLYSQKQIVLFAFWAKVSQSVDYLYILFGISMWYN